MNPEEILADLVAFHTINDPQNAVFPDSKILDFVINLLRSWDEELEVKKFKNENYSSIYLTTSLKQACEVLLMGHLDVVPVSKGWKSNPFKLHIESGLAYGRGTKDCKGSLLSALLAYKNLIKTENPKKSKIGFFISMDEESGGTHGANEFFKYVKSENLLPKFVINVDGGAQVVYKRRAGLGVRVKLPPQLQAVRGNSETISCSTSIIGDDNRHSAYFIRGADSHAVVALSKLLHVNQNWLLSHLRGSWVKGNVIPDTAEMDIVIPSKEKKSPQIEIDLNLTAFMRMLKSLILLTFPTEISSDFGITINPNIIEYDPTTGLNSHFDIRAFVSSDKLPEIINAFKIRLGQLAKIARVECSGTSGYFHTPESNILVTVASSVLKRHNLPYLPCEQEGASDARYASELNIPVIDIGPKGGHVHGSNEYINVNSMIEFGQIYQEIIDKLI